jgi:hypothetical protein
MSHELFSEHDEITVAQQYIMQALRERGIEGLEIRTLSDTNTPWPERISISCDNEATQTVIESLQQFLTTHKLTAQTDVDVATNATIISFIKSQ